jgi:hypothetical protein
MPGMMDTILDPGMNDAVEHALAATRESWPIAQIRQNPGANEPFGEWLPGGQGDDVVSGLVDVEPITALRDEQPAVYDELMDTARSLERLGSDVQEIEFTVEGGKLWLLQTRAAAHVQTLLLPALQPLTALPGRPVTELTVLQAVRLKGRVSPADLAATLDEDLAEVTKTAEQLTASGLPAEGMILRIGPSGRAGPDPLLTEERKGVSTPPRWPLPTTTSVP